MAVTYYLLSFLVICLSIEIIVYIYKLDEKLSECRAFSANIKDNKVLGKNRTIVSAFSMSNPRSVSSPESRSKLNNFANLHFNEGNDFNEETGIFTCSKPGVYHFSANLVKKRAYNESEKVDLVHCIIYKNTDSLLELLVDPTDGPSVGDIKYRDMSPDIGSAAVSNSIILRLKSDDIVFLGDCDNPLTTLEASSSFSGFLLYPDD